MEITVQHFEGQYPSFNIMLHTAPGSVPFITIRGCRIVQGKDGPFISYPSRKGNDGKYWNHVVGGDKFNEAVLKKAQAASNHKPAPKRSSGFDDMDDDIPF